MEVNKMKITKKIEKAKEYAQENWTQLMKKINAYNPKANRKWYEASSDKSRKIFALEGTPDKAFVVADLQTGEVKALNQNMETIKIF